MKFNKWGVIFLFIFSPSPRLGSPMDLLASMSPAARRLASSSLKLGLRTPQRTQLGTKASGLRSKTPKTPLQRIVTPKMKTPSSQSTEKKENLTDDLLKIDLPRRLTASDFFWIKSISNKVVSLWPNLQKETTRIKMCLFVQFCLLIILKYFPYKWIISLSKVSPSNCFK